MAILNFFPDGNSGGSLKDLADAVVTLASSSYTYDGTEKTQGITSVTYNGTALISGTDYIIVADSNKATNAGTHTIILAGMGNYSGIKTAEWSIAKAQGSITSPVQSITQDNYDGSVSYTLTIIGDGATSLSISNINIASGDINGNTITLHAWMNGDVTVTVTLANGNNFLGTSITIPTHCIKIDETFGYNTPEAIKRAVDKDIASNLWSVGDDSAVATITAFADMTQDSELCFFILGFDHNSTIEGKGITLAYGCTYNRGTDVCIDGSFKMNTSNTNTDGWGSSYMRNTTCPAFFNALPLSWQNIISQTKKWTANQGESSDVSTTETTETIFLLSQYELYADRGYSLSSHEGEKQKQYDYYKNGNSKVKCSYNDQVTAKEWWLRSPAYYSGYYGPFCSVNSSGNHWLSNASENRGLAPAFRIGPSNEVSA